jgi:hypothetical protein
MQPPNGYGMTFNPIVLMFTDNKEFRWKGKLGIKGIFYGEHYFKLIDNGNEQTKFIHGEKFSGIWVPLLGKTPEKSKEGFELMNKSLKDECEEKIKTTANQCVICHWAVSGKLKYYLYL